MFQGSRRVYWIQKVWKVRFMTDHLADALNTIKTHEYVGQDVCTVRATKLTEQVLNVLKSHNYLKDFKKIEDGRGTYFEVQLHGKINDCGVIKPRIPVRRHEWNLTEEQYIPAYNVGLLIISTPGGIMTNADAREQHTGGRLLAYVY
jgi:small subunit ribosomal protein S8